MSAELRCSDAQWSTRGCLVAIALSVAVVIAIGVAISSARKASRREIELKQAQRRTESFEKVKAGDHGNGILVFDDPQLIEMLARDPVCVANLTTLNLSSVDLSGPHTVAAGKLVNVKEVVFYDCRDADNLLKAMKGSPSIEELSFDTTQLSNDGVRLLTTFPNLRRVYFAWINDPAREQLVRKTLSGVEIEIAEPN